MAEKDNKRQNGNKKKSGSQFVSYKSMGLIAGLIFGVAYGAVLDSYGIGIPMGVCMGVCIGAVLDRQKRK
ncbi:MAG: hypothetical protein LUE21_08455 [Oscillospiraceae bacterium]|nr:hypothetical protein [Oscillospiraceae bacterium]